MKVIITGLTASTITFSEISVSSGAKLNLHGQETATVDIDTVYKSNEINSLTKAKLIKVESLEPITEPEEKEKEIAPVELVQKTSVKESEEVKEVKSGKKGPKPIRRKRGRPKGAKNINKTNSPVYLPEIKPPVEEEPETPSRTIVSSENGSPKESIMSKGSDIEDEETDSTRASIEAMAKLEEEEKEDKILADTLIDNEDLPINEQMGRAATVSIGKSTIKQDIKNSAVPESEQAKNADPFIDREIAEEIDKLDEKSNAFLDDPSDEVKNKDDETDDNFLEL